MGMFRRLGLRADEWLQPDAEADSEHQRVADDRNDQKDGRERCPGIERFVDPFLGEEADEWRQAAHRDRAGKPGRKGDRHRLRQPAELCQVAGAGLVVDQPGNHEQPALEQRVGDQIEHRALDRVFDAHAGHHHHQAERGDGGIGKHQLQVGLAHGQHRADDERHAAERRQNRHPRRGIAHHRVQPHQQINARLHHGCGVQIGRNRGRRLHGVRQPEMERKLRRLGERTAENQNEGSEIKRALPQYVTAGQQFGKPVRAGDILDRQHAGEQRQTTAAGHHQRLDRGAARGILFMVEADEQEGCNRGQLPEDEQHQQPIGDHHAEHCAHEHEHEGQEPRLLRVALHIAPGIEHDQRSDAGDQQREGQRKAVDQEGEAQAQARHPVIAAGQRLAIGNARHEPGELDQRKQRQQRQQPGREGFEDAVEDRR